ncbi:hypothetical protein BTH42_29865 [Burkholderia sp. SRS-W-2-2016]|uniref:hypothetical protein n=1 Tax=Burkholderia sp. SRS-W-2-2016 TaxID=1926878 RepID=UPI00094AE09E|nr:hypothetical protein [Burkholderia sp. SRS-W-2-2016]OLL27997.1 hypothetical protein BTH42_29865 [Burkholderia sp. SRS-W-2-2016]
MKYPFFVSVLALAACASPGPEQGSSIGQSQQPPAAVARCIATGWANASQQTVYMEHQLAGDRSFNVYVPGQRPPGGAAALVRPNGAGSSVGFRGEGGAAAGSVSKCL